MMPKRCCRHAATRYLQSTRSLFSQLSNVAGGGPLGLGRLSSLPLTWRSTHMTSHLPCLQIHSSGEFQDVLHMNPGSLVVLMCKAQVRW